MPLVELVQLSDWPFRSSTSQKNYGIGSNWFVASILLTFCAPQLQSAHDHISFCVLQVALEKVELLAALSEHEKGINLLEALYNDNKELLDQHRLDTDLRELAEYAWPCFSFARTAGSDDGAES